MWLPRRAALLSSVVVLGACAPKPGGPYPDAPVVLVSIDTLRADHLPLYGYRAGSTPNFDGLGREGIVFDDVYSHCPLTLPAHASLLTGLLPPRHGVRDNMGFRLKETHATLATASRPRALPPGGAISAYVLRAQTGIARGFDFYEDALTIDAATESLGDLQRDGAVAVERARALDGGQGESASSPSSISTSRTRPTRPPRGTSASPWPTTARWPTRTSSWAAFSSASRAGPLRPRNHRGDLRPRRGPEGPRRRGARHLPLSRGRARAPRPAPARGRGAGRAGRGPGRPGGHPRDPARPGGGTWPRPGRRLSARPPSPPVGPRRGRCTPRRFSRATTSAGASSTRRPRPLPLHRAPRPELYDLDKDPGEKQNLAAGRARRGDVDGDWLARADRRRDGAGGGRRRHAREARGPRLRGRGNGHRRPRATCPTPRTRSPPTRTSSGPSPCAGRPGRGGGGPAPEGRGREPAHDATPGRPSASALIKVGPQAGGHGGPRQGHRIDPTHSEAHLALAKLYALDDKRTWPSSMPRSPRAGSRARPTRSWPSS